MTGGTLANLNQVSSSWFEAQSFIKVGDTVGFQDRQNNDVYGEVIRLNQKTATIVTNSGAKWRVAYAYLNLIIDGEQRFPNLIEGEIIDL